MFNSVMKCSYHHISTMSNAEILGQIKIWNIIRSQFQPQMSVPLRLYCFLRLCRIYFYFGDKDVESAGYCHARSALTRAGSRGIIVHPTVLHKYTVVNV